MQFGFFFDYIFSKIFGEKWWCPYPLLHFRYQTAIPTIHPVKVDSDILHMHAPKKQNMKKFATSTTISQYCGYSILNIM